jgi:hypothetical protein
MTEDARMNRSARFPTTDDVGLAYATGPRMSGALVEGSLSLNTSGLRTCRTRTSNQNRT